MFEELSKEALESFRYYYGYSKRKYKSQGFCHKCGPDWINEIFVRGHKDKNCLNPPFCLYHDLVGHTATDKCSRWCFHCMKHGHSMRFYRKLKKCIFVANLTLILTAAGSIAHCIDAMTQHCK